MDSHFASWIKEREKKARQAVGVQKLRVSIEDEICSGMIFYFFCLFCMSV